MVPRKEEKYFGLGTPEFCAIDCIRDYINDKSKLNEDHGAWKAIAKVDPGECGEGMCYSHLLHMPFRSAFEAMVAEVMLFGWKWLSVFYEYHAVRVTMKKTYIPDFFVADHDVWIEVKGNWRSGDKKKFIMASEIMGQDRVILIPSFYWRGFKGATKEIRERACVGLG